ncbi:helix-turn-helix transcriptional regulator [Clostridium baratii]|uniref:helix-turn-helix transcriptional regulator n=1 Tax=Clostridium baratii TaxID=1561 RepID=UPI0030CA8E4F
MKITPIRMRRVKAELEIDEAVEELKISKGMLYRIEQGISNPGTKLIARMAKVYNCKVDDIFKDLKITG